MKNILIANSLKEIPPLLSNLLFALEKKDYFFHLLSSPADFLEPFRRNNWESKKIYFGPNLHNNFNFFLWLLVLPCLYVFYFFPGLYFKHKKNIKTLICLNWNEKIIFTPLAAALGVKVIWLESPEIDYRKMPAILLSLYHLYSRWSILVVFISFTEIQLKNLRFPADRIKMVPPGIKLNQFGRQETIFSTLAKADKSNFSHKYFTLGTTTDFLPPNQIENLFQAVKVCLTVIPNLQLIIVGANGGADKGIQKKRLDWLAKKLGISNLVWFVSEQENLRKWLDSFDVFIITKETPKLINLDTVLKIMSAGLPIIGFRNRGWEDMILEDKTGVLVEANHSEVLAQKIIEFYKNKHLCSNLGKNAKELAENNFTLEKMAEAMEQILK